MSERRLLDITAAAEYLSVGDKVVRKLIHDGRLPRVKLLDKKYLIDRLDLDRLIEEEKSEPLAPKTAPVAVGAKAKNGDDRPYKWLERYGIKA